MERFLEWLAGLQPLTIYGVSAVNAVNEGRKRAMADRVIAALGGSAQGRCVAVLGLTFKPNTDDMRDSPSLAIVPALIQAGATVRAVDPEGEAQARPLLPPGVVYCRDALDAATGADALVVVTEWNAFRALSPERLASVMKGRAIIDLRNIFDPAAMREAGFTYRGIGRPNA